jgi:hypothetical protein
LFWQAAGGGQIAEARNDLARKALDHGARWVFFCDDDHTFESDLLGRLLRHDVDIVVPVVLLKKPPHHWVAWKHFDIPAGISDEELGAMWGRPGHEARPEGKGLIEIGCGGTGAVLIRAEVFEALPEPWFQFGRILAPDQPGEDQWFFLKARRAGFRMFCDTSTMIGHLTTVNVMPVVDPDSGEVAAEYDFEFGGAIKQNVRGATLERV